MGLSVFSMVKRWVFWSVRSGIQVDVEVNLRQRCDSHSCYQTTTQTCWRKDIMENLFKTKLVKQQKHPNFVCSQTKKCVISARTPPQLTKSSTCQSQIPHEFETTRSPYGFSKACRTLPFFLDDAVRINASHERLMTSVDQMQLGVISCLYILEIMEMGKVSLLIMLPQNLDSLYILCCNSKNPVFSFGKTKRGLKFVDKVDDRRVDSRDHPLGESP